MESSFFFFFFLDKGIDVVMNVGSWSLWEGGGVWKEREKQEGGKGETDGWGRKEKGKGGACLT